MGSAANILQSSQIPREPPLPEKSIGPDFALPEMSSPSPFRHVLRPCLSGPILAAGVFFSRRIQTSPVIMSGEGGRRRSLSLVRRAIYPRSRCARHALEDLGTRIITSGSRVCDKFALPSPPLSPSRIATCGIRWRTSCPPLSLSSSYESVCPALLSPLCLSRSFLSSRPPQTRNLPV